MNIDHDLPPPRAADLMSEWRYWPPVSHDPTAARLPVLVMTGSWHRLFQDSQMGAKSRRRR